MSGIPQTSQAWMHDRHNPEYQMPQIRMNITNIMNVINITKHEYHKYHSHESTTTNIRNITNTHTHTPWMLPPWMYGCHSRKVTNVTTVNDTNATPSHESHRCVMTTIPRAYHERHNPKCQEYHKHHNRGCGCNNCHNHKCQCNKYTWMTITPMHDNNQTANETTNETTKSNN